MSKNKNLRKDLKTEAKKLLDGLMPNLKQRTINTYVDDIRYSDNINSIKRIIRQLTLLKDASKLKTKGVELTKSSLKGIRADNKAILEGLKVVKTKTSKRKSYFKEALNGTFKETYFYADEIPNFNSYVWKLNDTVVNKLLSNRLHFELSESNKLISEKIKRVSMRSFITVHCIMMKEGDSVESYGETDFYYNSRMRTISSTNNISTFLNDVYNEISNQMEVAAQGSGFGFKKYESFTIGTNTYKSAFGGSFIKLPNAIKNKKACINIINKDEQCFDWCLLAHKFYGSAKFSNKAYDYEKYWKDLKRPIDVEYPVSMDKYEEYENLNDMQINVFELKDFKEDGTDLRSSLSILYKSNIHRKNVVNLLLITDKDKCHYVLVKNISRLFNSQGDPRTK
jgi:hypothetical protein